MNVKSVGDLTDIILTEIRKTLGALRESASKIVAAVPFIPTLNIGEVGKEEQKESGDGTVNEYDKALNPFETSDEDVEISATHSQVQESSSSGRATSPVEQIAA